MPSGEATGSFNSSDSTCAHESQLCKENTLAKLLHTDHFLSHLQTELLNRCCLWLLEWSYIGRNEDW